MAGILVVLGKLHRLVYWFCLSLASESLWGDFIFPCGFELSFIIHFKYISLCSDRVMIAGGAISLVFLTCEYV